MSVADPGVLRKQLDLNFQRLSFIFLSYPVVGGVVAWIVSEHVVTRVVVIWLGLLCVTALLGVLLEREYKRHFDRFSLRQWAFIRTATAGVNGLSWGGYLSAFLFVPNSFELQAFILLVITVTSVMGIASSAVYFPAFSAYTVANLTPAIVRLLFEDARLQNNVALLLITFTGLLLIVGRHTNRGIVQQLELERDNRNLVRDLEAARDRLEETNQHLGERVAARTAELEEALTQKLQSEVQLRRAQKMDAIGRLAGGVAHDFNNTLTSIMGSASLLEMTLDPRSSEAEEVQAILASADRAALLTRQLLSLAKGGLAEPEVFDINLRLGSLTELLRRLLGENVKLVVVEGNRSCNVLMDPTQFDQLLMNLVVNARDASAGNGKVSIIVSSSSQQVQIAVEDEGSGIAPDVLEHIYEPFFTTKGDRGTGLGLSTCFGIVKRAQGSIDVQTQLGRGTTFTITLPEHTGSALATDANTPPPQSINWSRRTVLLVEDQQPLLRTASRILSEQGATVIPAGSAEEALSKLTDEGLSVDVVVTDVSLPMMSGIALVKQLRSDGYTGACLLMSGYIGQDQLQLRRVDGSLPLLPKPFTSGELVSAVGRALERSSPLNQIPESR